jgi:hypothetical protein
MILGFDSHKEDEERLQHDAYYSQFWGGGQITLGVNDEKGIYEELRRVTSDANTKIRILVDYSSMSRLWYAGILNWAMHAVVQKEIEIDFVYAVGKHKKELVPLVIDDIITMPGCEESAIRLPSSVVVFGLGFDSLATLCVLERMEPTIVYTYLANPAAFNDYVKRARADNKELRQTYSDANLELPLTRVEKTFRNLTELISPHRNGETVIMVPMGPKPHVLAAILLSMRFRGVVCLDVSGRRESPERVGTTGDVVVTRVELRHG